MLDTYRKLFTRNLSIVKNLAETDIETCVQLCEMYKGELSGILKFLFELDVIGHDELGSERDHVQETFNSVTVCGAYRLPGKMRKRSQKR